MVLTMPNRKKNRFSASITGTWPSRLRWRRAKTANHNLAMWWWSHVCTCVKLWVFQSRVGSGCLAIWLGVWLSSGLALVLLLCLGLVNHWTNIGLRPVIFLFLFRFSFLFLLSDTFIKVNRIMSYFFCGSWQFLVLYKPIKHVYRIIGMYWIYKKNIFEFDNINTISIYELAWYKKLLN